MPLLGVLSTEIILGAFVVFGDAWSQSTRYALASFVDSKKLIGKYVNRVCARVRVMGHRYIRWGPHIR